MLILNHIYSNDSHRVLIHFICLIHLLLPLQQTLSKALGIKGIVNKRRLLYMIGQTSVHLDCVEDLGDFMELEVHCV